MRRSLWLCLTLVACGAPPPSQPTPVKSTPLAGTVDGQPWQAISATASARKAFSDGGERWIDVSGTDQLNCTSYNQQVQLIGTVPWVTGEAYGLSFTQNLTILTRIPDGGIINNIALSGRVEVVSAPDAGVGTLRIRASAGSGNSVEGQIDVTVCD
jgi:hypothetical protein